MRTWRIGLRLLGRDWRSGELNLLAGALVLTVAAITAVGFFTDRIERAMQRQGGELIAADLMLDASAPVPAVYAEQARALGLTTASTLEFPSVIMGEQRPQLVQVKAVDAAYPLRGRLRVRADLNDGVEQPAAGPAPGEVWIEPRLLHLLEATPGDSLVLGESRLRIGRLIVYEPDRGGNLFQLAPRAMINTRDIAATGLVSPASRVRYRLLIAGSLEAVEAFKEMVASGLPSNIRLVDAREARPELSSAVERASRFLHLATLVTLLIAGAAIALASRRLVERQTDAVAIMRCLGARPHLLSRIYTLRVAVFGLAACAVGCLIGFLAQFGLAFMLADWFGPQLPPPSLRPLAVGIGTGLVALLGFALPPLFQLARVPPLRALRRDLGTPRASAAATVLAAAAALTLLIFWQAGEAELAWKLLAGVGGALIALVATVALLIRIAGALTGRARGIWRLGLAALTRRPTGALLQITGFGLGIMALLLLAVVRVDLLRTWQDSLPEGAPDHFLINIQPQEVESLRQFFADEGLDYSGLFPMVRGRLIRINEKPVDPDAYTDPRAQRLATRDFNLSWSLSPQADNRIVAGNWWKDAQAAPQFSVEEGLAQTLGMKLGDSIGFWVSGREIQARITSLRRVQWDSFNVNFFVLAPPSLLGSEAATYVTSFHLPDDREALIPDLVRAYPSVTLFDVDALIGQVRQIMDRGVMAVEYVFLFTLAAGILVMYAGIQASLQERRSEHGVLRTLGARRSKLLSSLAVEFTAAGLLAGLMASIFAELTGMVLARELFGLDFQLNPWIWFVGIAGSGLLVGLAGTLATYPLLIQPPLQTLRRAE
ncbi:MAG: FtsX-like permease family protein [Chromatiaceae bacterium]|nr:FtsX-like permease family protein [Chromatiaceae bacterium]